MYFVYYNVMRKLKKERSTNNNTNEKTDYFLTFFVCSN
jgi:hypothetical protein